MFDRVCMRLLELDWLSSQVCSSLHAGCQWLHATCLQKFDTLLSPSLCRGWYSKCSVLLFPHPHYLWNWTWLPRNEGEGISEEEAELGKRYFSSLPKAMRCCYLMLFDVICMFSCAVQSNCISTIFKDQRSKPDLQKVLWSIFASQMSLLKRPPNP